MPIAPTIRSDLCQRHSHRGVTALVRFLRFGRKFILVRALATLQDGLAIRATRVHPGKRFGNSELKRGRP